MLMIIYDNDDYNDDDVIDDYSNEGDWHNWYIMILNDFKVNIYIWYLINNNAF